MGFPGVVEIDRAQPITLTNSLGKALTASADSRDLFADAAQPATNVGQYDLQPLLSELQTEIPLILTLPTTAIEPTILSVSPSVVQEWQAVANRQ